MTERKLMFVRRSLPVAALLLAASCSSGSGGVASLRTVSGSFKTTYWLDDGSKTTVNSPPPNAATLKAILSPNGSAAGYTIIPITLDSTQSFTVSNVPEGPYFLQLDSERYEVCHGCPGPPYDNYVEVVSTQLIELRADSPDLTSVTAGRPDIVLPDPNQVWPIHLEVSGLAPWVPADPVAPRTPGDSVVTASSQANHYGNFAPTSTPPGSTVARGNWFNFGGLPDASKHDVLYAYQRSTTTVADGSSAGTVVASSRFARLTDLTMTQSTSNVSLTLTNSAPQTGEVSADIRYAQFAALAPLVHPTAVPSAFYGAFVNVVAAPHSVEYPDKPGPFEVTNLFFLANVPAPVTDVNYGTLHYGEFLDPLWKTYRAVTYTFDTQVPSALECCAGGSITSRVPMPAEPGPIVPVLGPPTQPRIEGRDAFADQNGVGVGLEPVITWSPPTLGQPTSYQITISSQTQPVIAGETRTISAIIYSGRRFKLPPGFLKQGSQYTATISARLAPWDTFDRAAFRVGVPFHTADCLTGIFSP